MSGSLVLALALASPAAGDAQTGQEAIGDEIVVVGLRTPYKLKVKELRGAVKAYRKGRAAYAPQSDLFFEVRPGPGGRLEGLQLSLVADGKTLPVTLDAQGRFVLPELGNDDWELVANRRRGGLVVRPTVMSPGTSESDRRLGDMRLQCEVIWAIERHHVSFVTAGLFQTAGGCRSSKLAIYAPSARPIALATVSAGPVSKPVQVLPNGLSFRAPLHDKSMPNEARVRFTYR